MSDQIPEPEPTEEPTSNPEPKSYTSTVMGDGVRTGLPRRTVRRLSIMGVTLAVVCYAFYWFISQKGDIQFASDTSKLIGAIQEKDSGSTAVVIGQDGKITPASGYTEGNTDRDIAWDPKGNRLFFISDRKEGGYQIFRWDPQRDNVEQRSVDRASRSNLFFDVQDKGIGDLTGLVIVRGTVHEFTPKTVKSQQVMPPNKRVGGDVENGSMGNFEMMYKRFGQSFKSARWFYDRGYIAAIMQREDKGEALIVQAMQTGENGGVQPPQLVFNAQKIGMTVDPKTGDLVFTVTDVLPMYDEDGRPLRDKDGKEISFGFTNAIFRTKFENGKLGVEPIGRSETKDECYVSPVVSPDGNSVIFLVGKYSGEGNYEILGLDSCPLTANGVAGKTRLVTGRVTDPCFSPDGTKMAFIKEDGGHQAVFIANSDGSDAKNLTGSSGDYSTPIFSPQYK